MERDLYGRFKSNRRSEPKWTGVATAVGFVVIAWWMGDWVAGVTVIVFFALLFALCVWLSRRDKRAEG